MRQEWANSLEALPVSLLLNFANKTILETMRIKEEVAFSSNTG